MPTKLYAGPDFDPATLPLSGDERILLNVDGVVQEATTQDIADLGGGGGTVTSVGCGIDSTVSDILAQSGSPITTSGTITIGAVDSGSDRIVFWDDSSGKLTYLTVGSGLSITGTTLTATDGGSGDVVGPASAVDDNIVTFDSTTGKLIQDGGQTIAQVISAARTPNVQTVTSSATVTPTFSNDEVAITAQAAGLTLANPSGTPVDGWGIVIRIKDNGTARSIAYGTQYRAIGVTLPTTTVISKVLYLAGIWNSTETTFDILAVAQQA